MKKNGALRVCIDFRDLNVATPKDEYPMLVADILVHSACGNDILSLIDDYLTYNQNFIAKILLKLHLDVLAHLKHSYGP